MTIPIYVFVCVILLFGGIYLQRQEQRNKIRQLIVAEPQVARKSAHIPETFLGKISYFLHNHLGILFPSANEINKVSVLLVRANLNSISAEEIFALRIIAMAICGVFTYMFFAYYGADILLSLTMGCTFGYFGYLSPKLYISNKADNRQKKAKSELLDYIELNATATEAGLSIHDSIKRVAEYSPGVLSEEFQKAWTDIYGGASRSQAFLNLAKRLDVEDINIFIDDILQAEKQGTPIARVMKRQAQRIRENTNNRAIESAQKAASKIIFPTIIFMLLPLFALAMAPIFISLSRSFKF